MPRVTVITDVKKTTELEAFDIWLSKWKDKLIYLSPNEGCGCCVNIFNIEAPEDAISELPPEIKAASDWAQK